MIFRIGHDHVRPAVPRKVRRHQTAHIPPVAAIDQRVRKPRLPRRPRLIQKDVHPIARGINDVVAAVAVIVRVKSFFGGDGGGLIMDWYSVRGRGNVLQAYLFESGRPNSAEHSASSAEAGAITKDLRQPTLPDLTAASAHRIRST